MAAAENQSPGKMVSASEQPSPDQPQSTSAGTTGFVDLIHEIRNPLNNMYTTLQLLQRHLASRQSQDAVLLSYLDGLQDEIRRLHEILRDLQSAWTAELRLTPIHMDVLISELLRSEPLNSAGSRVRVETEIQSNCPVFESDEHLLKRALANLIRNSLEAMPSGGTLTLRGSVRKENVVIEVSDTGSGIPQEIKPFAAYTTSKPAGMGLGLSIVKQIAGSLRAEVGYTNRAEGGTTFRVTLPQHW